MNAYEILGVAPDATEEQIKAAYRALAAKYSGEEYAQSPMKEEAEAKMNEINAAFDEAMSRLRVGESSSQAGQQAPGAGQSQNQGQTPPRYTTGPQNGAGGKWAAIRQLINAGRVDEALAELNAIPGGASQAEWNFLMAMALYRSAVVINMADDVIFDDICTNVRETLRSARMYSAKAQAIRADGELERLDGVISRALTVARLKGVV